MQILGEEDGLIDYSIKAASKNPDLYPKETTQRIISGANHTNMIDAIRKVPRDKDLQEKNNDKMVRIKVGYYLVDFLKTINLK